MSTPEPAGGSAVRSVSRALSLLTIFSEDQPIRTLRELVDSAELPKTTVLRLIQTLETFGYLYARPDGRYCLGPTLIRLSRAVAQVWRLPVAADATMETVREQTRETVNLYVLEGKTRVCVAQKQGPQNIRYVIPTGVPLPLWGGASAKVLLAGRSPKFVEDVLRSAGKDIRYRDWFRHEVERARTEGVAVSHGEREPHASSVAAPIRTGEQTIAALAISGPSTRFTAERVDEISAILIKAVEQMQRSFAAELDGEGQGTAWEVKSTAR
ncbi:MAG: IclR family transcriptional regulator [Candidatus Dormibacteraceae bacterium]